MTIDELIVELVLDASKFTKGQRDAIASFKKTQEEARKQTKETEEVARRNADTLSAATNKVLGFVTAWAGLRAVSGYIQNITNADAAVGRTARTLEISTRTLSAWEGVAQRAGGTAGEMAGFMQGLVHQFQTLSLLGQGGEFIRWFRAIGVEAADDNGKLRDMGELLKEVNAALAGQSPSKAAAFIRHLGGGEGIVNALTQAPAAVRQLLAEQEQLGLPDPKDARRAQELQKSWLDLAQATTSLVRELSSNLVPAVTEFLRSVTFGLSWFRTPAGRARADAQGDQLTQNLRGRAGGGPEDVDAWLRSKLGGTGGFLVPLAQWMSGGTAAPGAGAAPTVTLRVKPGAQGAGASHPGTMRLAETLQSTIPGLNRFTSFNDSAHGGRPSAHNRGLALDFSLTDPAQAGAVAQQIRDKLAALGINATVIDEYSRPSPFSTGGHIHVQFNSAGDAQRFQAGGGGAAPAMSAAQLGAPTPGAMSGSGVAHTTTVDIKSIIVNTQATDARGIAGSLVLETAKAWASQANYGPSG